MILILFFSLDDVDPIVQIVEHYQVKTKIKQTFLLIQKKTKRANVHKSLYYILGCFCLLKSIMLKRAHKTHITEKRKQWTYKQVS